VSRQAGALRESGRRRRIADAPIREMRRRFPPDLGASQPFDLTVTTLGA
jgi:hypothetical protein